MLAIDFLDIFHHSHQNSKNLLVYILLFFFKLWTMDIVQISVMTVTVYHSQNP